MAASISVVIPVFNRKEELIRALDSVKKQTLQPSEVIVVDDCSSFLIEDFLRESNYLDQDWVRVVRNEINQGPSGTRNTGVMHAKEEFIAFLDSDDYWDPHKLEKQMALFTKKPELDLVYNGTWVVYENKTVPSHTKLFKDNIWYQLVDNCWTPPNPSTMLMRNASIRKLNAFDLTLKHAEDIDLWMRMTLHDMKIDYCDERLTYFMYNSTGRLSKQYRAKFKKVEPFFAKWEPYFRQQGKESSFHQFKQRSFTKFALETFVDSLRDRSVSIPAQMYFKYLWNRKEFYDLILNKFRRVQPQPS
ncbi:MULTISPECIES: glycosyltransferase family A protein [Xanthocytophaga]|uniref:Glycosyltransferase family A protein n=2 Tax=Xanthocytophaga TaxID=3078918 RepID=A0AAE3QXI8_9BACT|nr:MULTISPECIES: glycosyltransferase family A protein [Xanthocytophaga]MDJ1484990.1 glycosyltransferase family A protein [Xanthocytophaga flavus]MDJ1502008.1 glycosyltransferase family A protein [Xanthocytophaga agilis]